MELEDKKREMARLRRKNEENCRKNRVPESTTGRKSTRVTVPKEFSLSRTNTPRRREASLSDNEDSVCSARSVRREQASARTEPSSARKWTPTLTVPKGPTCADAEAVERR